jgi:hypothetical protein
MSELLCEKLVLPHEGNCMLLHMFVDDRAGPALRDGGQIGDSGIRAYWFA